MSQLTIRTNSKALEAKLKELASERSCSLNQAANFLLRKGAGLLDPPQNTGVGNQLDAFIGSWSEEEANALDERVAEVRKVIDEEIWR